MRISEAELDHAFAECLSTSAAFQQWLLGRGRFARYAATARLLHEEQASVRKKAKHWWKHWWCRMPDGSDGETDIFAVFEAGDVRFAIHIENKPPDGSLSMRQASRYRPRAAFKAFEEGWLSYSDFETILIAPRDFIATHGDQCRQFDVTITYEEIARFVPIFGSLNPPLAK